MHYVNMLSQKKQSSRINGGKEQCGILNQYFIVQKENIWEKAENISSHHKGVRVHAEKTKSDEQRKASSFDGFL